MLACALVGWGVEAKPEKRTSPPANVAFLRFVRPENQGLMNRVPAHVLFEPRGGVVEGRVTRAGARPKAAIADPRRLVLAGGDKAAFTVRPGTYSLKALTPVKDQPPPVFGGKREVDWKSPEVKIVLERGETICIVVEPGITGADYDGSWLVAKAATPDDCGARDWSDFHQRMHYIVHLFRAFHLSQQLSQPPFNQDQVTSIGRGVIPEGEL